MPRHCMFGALNISRNSYALSVSYRVTRIHCIICICKLQQLIKNFFGTPCTLLKSGLNTNYWYTNMYFYAFISRYLKIIKKSLHCLLKIRLKVLFIRAIPTRWYGGPGVHPDLLPAGYPPLAGSQVQPICVHIIVKLVTFIIYYIENNSHSHTQTKLYPS